MLIEAHIKVDDPKVQQIRWAKECLFIRFGDNKACTYYDVPAAVFIGMLVASSAYDYWEVYLDGKYESKQ